MVQQTALNAQALCGRPELAVSAVGLIMATTFSIILVVVMTHS
jgi:hypothetical protein